MFIEAALAHGFVDEEANPFGYAFDALLVEKLHECVEEFSLGLVGHVRLVLEVFRTTPTESQHGPPSTSFSRPVSPPSLWGAATLGSLRSPSLRLPPKGGR